MGWLRAFLLLALGHCYGAAGGKVKYWQNCAARGPCRLAYGHGRDPAVNAAAPGSPKGHLKPLGHPDFEESWAGEIDVLTELEPEVFWKKYHAQRKPFLLKGASTSSQAMKWTDDYIMREFGDVVGKTEWQNEDRLTDYCGQNIFGEYINCPKDTIPYVETRMNIRTFVNKSLSAPEKFQKYIISQMPDGMGKDFHVPGFHLCGKRDAEEAPDNKPWMTQMYENNFWYVRTKPHELATSVIHYDMNHQIMCLFSGRKEWIMWDLRADGDKIPMWNRYFRADGTTRGSDDSPVDGERVDLERWPKFAQAKWSNTTMEPGDCLFTPATLLHYVRSFSDDVNKPTIALMTMFRTSEHYSKRHCSGDMPQMVSLNEFDTLWDFPGSDDAPFCKNHVKMGYADWKKQFLHPLRRRLKGKPLTREAFMQHFSRGGHGYSTKRIKKAWEALAGKDGTEAPASWPRSPVVFNLARDISCKEEGHKGPEKPLADGVEWTARNEYALAGGTSGMVDAVHDEF